MASKSKQRKTLKTKMVSFGRNRKYSQALAIPGSPASEQRIVSNKALTSDYKCITGGSSAFKEGILSKVVQHLQSTYLIGEDSIYTIEELLGKAKIQSVSNAVKVWLRTEALPRSERVRCAEYLDGVVRYSYNPPLDCADQSELLDFLRRRREETLEGVLDQDILASVPHGERVLAAINDQVCSFERQDKKRSIFYDQEKTMWEDEPAWMKELKATVSVYGYNDEKIEDSLRQVGITPAKERFLEIKSKAEVNLRKKRRKCPARRVIRDNAHVEGLETYDEFF